MPEIPQDLATFRKVMLKQAGSATPVGRVLRADQPLHVARAPGRLDVMGGIADYSGALVLQMPIAQATCCAAQWRDDDQLVLLSLSGDLHDAAAPHRVAQFELARLRNGDLADYAAARAAFARTPDDHWASYLAGTVLVLLRDAKLKLPRGVTLVVHSEVPEGKGVSSSAALEVAVAYALLNLTGKRARPEQVGTWCQCAENRVVGAPCGIMDQMASACGRADALLRLRCQPATIEGYVKLPRGLALWGIDSGLRHAVSGSDYGSVRTAAFMGYRIIADLAGLPVEPITPGKVRIHDASFAGYLANVPPSLFVSRFAGHLPTQMAGAAFLERYAGITDSVCQVVPHRTYAVAAATAHPVFEDHRIRAFAQLLTQAPTEERCRLLGEMMYQSHASYSACGLGSDGTDRLVELVRAADPATGLYGAKITGGGSGGTVAVLGRSDADGAVQALAEQYGAETGHAVRIFRGSSPGAGATAKLRQHQT